MCTDRGRHVLSCVSAPVRCSRACAGAAFDTVFAHCRRRALLARKASAAHSVLTVRAEECHWYIVGGDLTTVRLSCGTQAFKVLMRKEENRRSLPAATLKQLIDALKMPLSMRY